MAKTSVKRIPGSRTSRILLLLLLALVLTYIILRYGYLFVGNGPAIILNLLVLMTFAAIYHLAGRWLRIIMLVLFCCWLFTLLQVAMLCFFKPHNTPLMLKQKMLAKNHPEYMMQQPYTYVPLEQISPYLIQAADIGEDEGTFMYHRGFFINRMISSYLANEKGNSLRGGSCISQQTAKNCFLLQSRTTARKLVEAHYTILIEYLWGKRRIMEYYLNIIEYGNGIFGCEAASQYYFNHPASQLSWDEAVQLVASLPSPRQSNPNHHTPNYNKRIKYIYDNFTNYSVTDPIRRRKDYNPEILMLYGRSPWFFLKWLVKHELFPMEENRKVPEPVEIQG